MAKKSDSTKPVESARDWIGELLSRPRALITEAAPEMTEERKWVKPTNPAGGPTFSHNGLVCPCETYKRVVKMTFARWPRWRTPQGCSTPASRETPGAGDRLPRGRRGGRGGPEGAHPGGRGLVAQRGAPRHGIAGLPGAVHVRRRSARPPRARVPPRLGRSGSRLPRPRRADVPGRVPKSVPRPAYRELRVHERVGRKSERRATRRPDLIRATLHQQSGPRGAIQERLAARGTGPHSHWYSPTGEKGYTDSPAYEACRAGNA